MSETLDSEADSLVQSEPKLETSDGSQLASQDKPAQSTNRASPKKTIAWALVIAGITLIIILTKLIFFPINSINTNHTIPVPAPSIRLSLIASQTLIPKPSPTTIPAINSTYNISLDTNTWKTFTSPLGFSFKYPSEWGNVEEIINDAKTEGSGDSGKTYGLFFSNIDYENYDPDGIIYGSGRSSDYSAGRGSTDNDFYGDQNLPKEVKATIWARPTTCIIPISSMLYGGRIDFNLPGEEISGVRLKMKVISETQVKILDEEYEKLTIEEKSAYCQEEKVEKDATIFINEMEKRDLDELSQKQLKVFKEILSSAKVL